MTPASGTAAPKIPYGFVGTWTPPSQYGTLTSSPIILSTEDWTSLAPPGANTSAAWDWTTNLGQVIGGVWFVWGTDVQSGNYCAPLYSPSNAPKTGPSVMIGNTSVSSPSINMVVKMCMPLAVPVEGTEEEIQQAVALLNKALGQLSS